jgi:hypothetical protein
MIKRIILMVLLGMLMCVNTNAEELVMSSDNLDFTEPLNVLSNPSTTIQMSYSFSLYRQWLCMDIRGRTAQQSNSETVFASTPAGIVYDKITILPSIDTGIRVKLPNAYHVEPYLFSLLNYTMINSSMTYQNYQTNNNMYALGLRTGLGMNILFGTQLPGLLLNMDMGYQYLPVTIAHVGNINMDGLFLSMGFGLSF